MYDSLPASGSLMEDKSMIFASAHRDTKSIGDQIGQFVGKEEKLTASAFGEMGLLAVERI
jgi:hypothetical protein